MLLFISITPLLFPRFIIIYLTTPELKNKFIAHNMINKLTKLENKLHDERTEIVSKLKDLSDSVMKDILEYVVQSDDEFSIIKFMASQPSDFPQGPTFRATWYQH
eukprot:GFUD01061795.1.p1 GENE.GFUD01061795.1~~GFUD01061795.1.p1  ORF type:complete len:105 (+),score=17.94 GFUD01061795.1:75-389(+)